jgi:hypothetical protein
LFAAVHAVPACACAAHAFPPHTLSIELSSESTTDIAPKLLAVVNTVASPV